MTPLITTPEPPSETTGILGEDIVQLQGLSFGGSRQGEGGDCGMQCNVSDLCLQPAVQLQSKCNISTSVTSACAV